MPYIDRRGYVIPLDEVTKPVEELIKKELLVEPTNKSGFDNMKSFKAYECDDENYYVPRYWGLEKINNDPEIRLSKTSSTNFKFNKQILKPTQLPIIDKMVKHFNGKKCRLKPYQNKIINVGTGVGKTVMALFLMCYLQKRTLIITHTKELADQWVERIDQNVSNATIGYIQGQYYVIKNCNIVIATVQSLMKTNLPIEKLLKDFDLVIYDEAHHYASGVFSNVMRRISTAYSISLSATVERSDNLEYVMMWYLGDIGYKTEGQLDYDVDMEIVKFKSDNKHFKQMFLPKKIKNKPLHNSSGMITNLTLIEERNNMIVNIVKDLLEKEPERYILLVSHRVEHILYLRDRFDEIYGKDFTGVIIGKKNQKKLSVKDMKTIIGKKIIIGIYHLCSEGLDIRTLCTVFPVTPLKRVLQVYGRMFRRKKHEYKYKPKGIDIIDDIEPFNKWYYSRLAEYKKSYLNGEKSTLNYYECNNNTNFIVKHKTSENLTKLLRPPKKLIKSLLESDSEND